MCPRETTAEALDRIRDLHRRGRHREAAAMARVLIDRIVFGEHAFELDSFATQLDAQTLLADAHLELGEFDRAQFEFDNVLRRAGLDELDFIDAVAQLGDLEIRQNVAYGQIKQVELAASALDTPSDVLACSRYASRVARASDIGAIMSFADHQRARALRVVGRFDAAIGLWRETAARIRLAHGAEQPPAGYPAARSELEVALTLAVLDSESAECRGVRARLAAQVALLDAWDRAALDHLVASPNARARPELDELDSGELRRTRTAAWFDTLVSPRAGDVEHLIAAVADGPFAAQLYYPMHAALRRTRAGLELPERLERHIDELLHELDPGIVDDFGLPEDARALTKPESLAGLARIISL